MLGRAPNKLQITPMAVSAGSQSVATLVCRQVQVGALLSALLDETSLPVVGAHCHAPQACLPVTGPLYSSCYCCDHSRHHHHMIANACGTESPLTPRIPAPPCSRHDAMTCHGRVWGVAWSCALANQACVCTCVCLCENLHVPQ